MPEYGLGKPASMPNVALPGRGFAAGFMSADAPAPAAPPTAAPIAIFSGRAKWRNGANAAPTPPRAARPSGMAQSGIFDLAIFGNAAAAAAFIAVDCAVAAMAVVAACTFVAAAWANCTAATGETATGVAATMAVTGGTSAGAAVAMAC